MKAVILAGGYGTRFSEETGMKPKPMIEIGGKPILWHILKLYSHYGINDFIVCLGYKGYVIKEYFMNYFLHQSDVTFFLKDNDMKIHSTACEPWTITLVDTGEGTETGGRLHRVKDYVGDGTFCLTYGDGVSDVNIEKVIAFHRKHNKIATLVAVQPPGRFGSLDVNERDGVSRFVEKPLGDNAWINGGFFVFEPGIFDYVEMDTVRLEGSPLSQLASLGELMAFKHRGFWLGMDTLRDKNRLESLWSEGKAPWRVWE